MVRSPAGFVTFTHLVATHVRVVAHASFVVLAEAGWYAYVHASVVSPGPENSLRVSALVPNSGGMSSNGSNCCGGTGATHPPGT